MLANIKKIDDLPSSLDEFKESIKTVIFTEKLSNANCEYRLIEAEFEYLLKITGGFPIVRIPKNASASTPPMVNVNEDQLRPLTLQEKGKMIEKLLKIGMIKVGSSSQDWSFVFGNLNSFYDFYVIWNDYCKK